MALAPTPDTRGALLALLDWYVESGVDVALDEAPHDRYADSARAAASVIAPPAAPLRAPEPPKGQALTQPRPAPAVAPPDEAARAAAAAAVAAPSLDALAEALAQFPHAPFRDMAQHFLFGAGCATAPLMVFDEAPGDVEEAGGEAFSGPSARLLDNMLAAIGRSRESACLAYAAPWRPPGDRTLTQPEIAVFAPFARRRVELARPKAVLLFGEAPARMLLESGEPLGKLRGRRFEIRCGDHVAQGFVFNSLDAILGSWSLKPAAWRDLRAAAAALEE
ncbi:MAG: uracil-DNA glycosylase [Methylocystis sp.]|uniref:uracil-DNA glycosylase n=1 Tax=Methylocystis sp. TaxID=1911079 RepID=UPI003DA37022